MDQRLNELYRELTEELKNLFIQILEKESGDSQFIPYKGSNAYDNRQDKGRIIVGKEIGENLSYAYRLRFNVPPNEPEKIKWFGSSTGFNDLSVILGEEDFIKQDVIDLYEARTNSISESEKNYIEQLFDEIKSQRRTVQEQHDISSVKNLIEDHNKQVLQNVICSNRESAVEMWKLLYSKNSDGEVVENDISIPFSSDNMLLCRTERGYNKSDGSLKKYPVGLVIEETDGLDNFFIYRLPRDSRLDDSNYNWTQQDIQDIMGFDEDCSKNQAINISPTDNSRIDSNIIVSASDYTNEYRSYKKTLFTEIQQSVHHQYRQMFIDDNDINVSVRRCDIRGDGLYIDDQATTDEIITVQSEVGISESQVRKQQERRDIGRLSSHLRADIVKNLYLELFTKWISNKTHSELRNYQFKYEENKNRDFGRYMQGYICGITAKDELREFMIEDPINLDFSGLNKISDHLAKGIFESENKTKLTFENKLIEIKNSNRHPYYKSMNGYDRHRIDTVIVPNNGTVLRLRTKGDVVKRFKLQKGLYEFRELNYIPFFQS